MREMHAIRLAVVLVAAAARVTSDDPSDPAAGYQAPPSAQLASANKADGKLFFPFVYSSTLTVFSVQSVTSTVPLTCFKSLTGTATACTGRRRRRRSGRLARPRGLAPPQLSSSVPELRPSVGGGGTDPAGQQASRLVLTSWITVVSSVTSVSTVTTFGTTVSLDLLCSIGGTTYLPFCGGR